MFGPSKDVLCRDTRAGNGLEGKRMLAPSTMYWLSAAVVRVKGTTKGLAVSVDGNGRFCYLNPYRGAMLAVAEVSRSSTNRAGRPKRPRKRSAKRLQRVARA